MQLIHTNVTTFFLLKFISNSVLAVKKIIYIFGCTGSLLLLRLSLVAESGGTLWVHVRASHCGGFSSCRAWALGHAGFSSCSTWAQQLWLPSSRAQVPQWWRMGVLRYSMARGIFLIRDPALAGRFFTTKPPGKPSSKFLFFIQSYEHCMDYIHLVVVVVVVFFTI